MKHSFCFNCDFHSLAISAALSILTLWPCTGSTQDYAVIHDFCAKANCADGLWPTGLLPDGNGGFFGTTASGGIYNQGTVFEIISEQGIWKLDTLHSFCAQNGCFDGKSPNGGLIEDEAGNLYGTAGSESGVVFELARGAHKNKWKFQILYSFCAQQNCTDGAAPGVGLFYAGQSSKSLYDGQSPLYGTTVNGGASGGGAVFELQRKEKGGWRPCCTVSALVNASTANGRRDYLFKVRGAFWALPPRVAQMAEVRFSRLLATIGILGTKAHTMASVP